MTNSSLGRAADAFWRVARAAVEAGHLPSALLAVANREEILCCEAIGGRQGETHPRKDSIFLLASITKPIIATAVLRLVEQGLILLHEPVANHWPEFAANNKEAVTLWHLLTHTSGLDESNLMHRDPSDRGPIADLEARRVAATFLGFSPGTRYRYCNAAFRVMAVLIERLTGQGYVEYLDEQVLRPLGMIDTTFRPDNRQSERVMPVLDLPFDRDLFVSAAFPSAGYWSTAADLVAFGQAYLGGGQRRGVRVLQPATVAMATRVHYEGVQEDDPIRPSTVYRGLGFSIVGPKRSELVPVGVYGHGGATGTRLWIDPLHDLVLVFLTNRWNQDNRWRDRAINAFYGQLED